jgi:hypothetical protein
MKLALKSFALLFFAFLLLVGYAHWKTQWAKARAETLCGEYSVGASAVGLEERAAALGLKFSNHPSIQNIPGHPGAMTLSAWEGFVFARWFCTVNYSPDGRVLGANVNFLD